MAEDEIPEDFHFNAESDEENHGGGNSVPLRSQQAGSTPQTQFEVKAPAEPPASARAPPRYGRRHQPAADAPAVEGSLQAPTGGLVPATSLFEGNPKVPEPAKEEKPRLPEPERHDQQPLEQEPSLFSDLPLFSGEPTEQPVFGRGGGKGRRLRPKAASPDIPLFGVHREVASPSIPAKSKPEPEPSVEAESRPEPSPLEDEIDPFRPPLFGAAAKKTQKEESSLFSSELPVEQPLFGKKSNQKQIDPAAEARKATSTPPGRTSAGPSRKTSPCNSPVPAHSDDAELHVDPLHPPVFRSAARKYEKEAERASTQGRASTPLGNLSSRAATPTQHVTGKLSPRAATPTQPVTESRASPEVLELKPLEALELKPLHGQEPPVQSNGARAVEEEPAEEYEADFVLDEENVGETSAIVDTVIQPTDSEEPKRGIEVHDASGLELQVQTPKSSSLSQFSEQRKQQLRQEPPHERPESSGDKPRSASQDARGQTPTKPAPVAARPPPARKPPPDPDQVLSEKAIEHRAQLAFQATLRKALVNSTAPLPRALEGLPAMSLKNAPQMTQNIFLEMSRSEAEQWLKDEQRRAQEIEARIAVQEKLAQWHEQREAAKQAEFDRKAKEEQERQQTEKAQYEKWKKRHEALQQKVAEWASHKQEQQEKADREGVEAAKRAKSEEAKRRSRKKEENEKKILQWHQEKAEKEKEERAAEEVRREREAQENQAAEVQSKPKSGGRGKGRGKSRKGSRGKSKEAAGMRKSRQNKEAETTKRMPDPLEKTGDAGTAKGEPDDEVEESSAVEESIGDYSENFESTDQLGASTLAGGSVSAR